MPPEVDSSLPLNDELAQLRQEHAALTELVHDMRRGEELGRHLIAEQFKEVDRVLTLLQNENALRKSLLDATDQLSIIYADANGTVRMFNRGAELMLGYASEDVVGSANLLTFHVPAEIAEIERETGRRGIQSLIALTRRGQLKNHAWFYLTRAGQVIPIKLSISLVHDQDDNVSGLVCSAMDIVEIKAAEAFERQEAAETLRLSEQRFSVIFHSSPVAMSVVETSAKGKIIDINDAWLKQFGLTREQVIGKIGLQFSFWKESVDRETLYACMMDNNEVNGLEAWLVRSHRPEPILCTISGRRFAFGGKQFAIFSFEDITAQRQAEETLREFNAQLENRVSERTKALQNAYAELGQLLENLMRTQDELVRSEKLAGLGSLVAGIAHELNTPIGNSVMVASHLLEASQKMDEVVHTGLRRSALEDFLNSVSSGANLLVRNLNKAAELVASFKQVAVDQTSSQRREFNLAEVVAEVVLTMGPGIRKSGCTVAVDIPGDIRLDSYPGPLGQILTNLINNAILHGFDGRKGGTVHIAAASTDDPGKIELRLCDNGNGIPGQVLPRVFDPFFTTKLGSGGTGLGLNIVHNMVTGILGGRINVESDFGKGACFILILPLLAPRQTEAADRKLPAPG